jgi:hypothetical protein
MGAMVPVQASAAEGGGQRDGQCLPCRDQLRAYDV